MTDHSMDRSTADHRAASPRASDAGSAGASAEQAEQAVRDHEQVMHGRAGQAGPVARHAEQEPTATESRSILPGAGALLQAGAFGAALGGMTTGVMEMGRVKQGEITTDEAMRNVVKSSAQGAATMAVATVASHIVRSHPVFGFIALAAAGIGAYVTLKGVDPKAESTGATPVESPTTKPKTAK